MGESIAKLEGRVMPAMLDREGVMVSKNESGVDTFIYVIFCILSLGTVWLTRIVISQAIRCAIKD